MYEASSSLLDILTIYFSVFSCRNRVELCSRAYKKDCLNLFEHQSSRPRPPKCISIHRSSHGSAVQPAVGELHGGRDDGAAASARRRQDDGEAALLLGPARQQVPRDRGGAAGHGAGVRVRGLWARPRRGAQHAGRAGVGVHLVAHRRRSAGHRVHGAAVPLPGLRHLLLGRRGQGLHGRRHLPRPRQLHPRARHRALQHPPPASPQHHVALLRGPGEAAAAAAGHLRHYHVHQHVDPQHAMHRHDDAGGYGDPAALPARSWTVVSGGRHGGPAVLQGGGAGGDVRVHHRRDVDADGHGRQHHPGGHVVHILPGAAAHHLQLMDVLRLPRRARPLRGALDHALPHVLLQQHRESAVGLPRQEPSQEGARLAWSNGFCREDDSSRVWGPDCAMDDEEPDERHPWVGSPLPRQSWRWNSHHHDDDSALHNPQRQGRRREAHGLGQVPEAAVEHHPPPRRGLRHRRRLQGQRPDGHTLGGAGLPEGRAAAGDRARGLPLQRRHHGVHVRRRRHHAGSAAAGRAGKHHRRAPAAAHGPRHHRRAAVLPAAHRLAAQRRRLRHRLHHHQGHGAHRTAHQNRRRCHSRRPTANARFSGLWHGSEVVLVDLKQNSVV